MQRLCDIMDREDGGRSVSRHQSVASGDGGIPAVNEITRA